MNHRASRRSLVAALLAFASLVSARNAEARPTEAAPDSPIPIAPARPAPPQTAPVLNAPGPNAATAVDTGADTGTLHPTSSAPERAPLPAVVAAAPSIIGFHQGQFFLRDADDYFRLYVSGRVHVDNVSFFGAGLANLPADQALKSTFTVRRARLELGGEVLQNRFQWGLSGEFGPTAVDNVGARNEALDCSVDPTSAAQTCSTRAGAIEAPAQRPVATDAWINWAAHRWFNVQAGQFFLPFMLENRLGDNHTPFLERALAVRAIGAPTGRDIGAMAWGEAPETQFYYAIGVFNGDGPNRPNADSRYDLAGRMFSRPFARQKNAFYSRLQVGVSARYGTRDRAYVGYDLPPLTTQGGYGFWRPTYRDAANRLMHIMPSGEQGAFAAEAFIPLGRVDITSEFVYAVSNTREAVDGYQLSPFTERLGSLKGFGYYIEASVWALGDRAIIGYPGYSKPIHVDLTKPAKLPDTALQFVTKFEQLALKYRGASRSGIVDKATPDGDIRAFAFTLGATYWGSRHLRLSANYVVNYFPGSEPVSPSVKGGVQQTAEERALGPAQNLVKGQNDSARDDAHSLHEVQFRIAVQF